MRGQTIRVRLALFRIFLLPGFALVASMSALAGPYSYQVNAGYTDSDGPLQGSERTSIQGSYFFDPVVRNAAPAGEAAFASRASSVSLGGARTSINTPTGFARISLTDPPIVPPDSIFSTGPVFIPAPVNLASGFGTDSDDYRGAIRYVHESGWLAEASLSAVRPDSAGFDSDTDVYSVAIGKYIGPTTTVTLGYRREETDSDNTTNVGFCLFPPCPLPATLRTEFDDSGDTWSARARHLVATEARHHLFAGSVSYSTRSTDFRTSITGDTPFTLDQMLSNESHLLESSASYTFYPLSTLGLGLSFRHTDAEDYTSNAQSFFVEWFVTDAVGFSLRYLADEQPLLPGTVGDVDSWELALTGRF